MAATSTGNGLGMHTLFGTPAEEQARGRSGTEKEKKDRRSACPHVPVCPGVRQIGVLGLVRSCRESLRKTWHEFSGSSLRLSLYFRTVVLWVDVISGKDLILIRSESWILELCRIRQETPITQDMVCACYTSCCRFSELIHLGIYSLARQARLTSAIFRNIFQTTAYIYSYHPFFSPPTCILSTPFSCS